MKTAHWDSEVDTHEGDSMDGVRCIRTRWHCCLYRYPSLKGLGIVIVGVAAEVRDISFRTAVRRTMYLPQAQAPDLIASIRPAMPFFVVRSTLPLERLEIEFRQAVRAVDPPLSVP